MGARLVEMMAELLAVMRVASSVVTRADMLDVMKVAKMVARMVELKVDQWDIHLVECLAAWKVWS